MTVSGQVVPLRHDASDRLRLCVRSPRVTAAAIAREAGLSQTFLSQVLAGERRPSRRVVEAALALGVSPDVFYDKGASAPDQES